MLRRELESLRGEGAETKKAPSRETAAPASYKPAPPQRAGVTRPVMILVVMGIVFALCIAIFFMGVQVNDLSEQNDALQAQLDDYQQMQFLNYTATEAIEAALADPWVSQSLGPMEQESVGYGYNLRTFALLTARADGMYWNVLFVGLDCDCDPPIFNSILALVNAQTGEVPQAYQGLHMNEADLKDSIWSNLTIGFWP